MKSRVQRNKELYESLSQDSESNLDNSNLSHFASRLSQIDDQFESLHQSKKEEREPSRKKIINDNEDVESEIENFETFENNYLKSFLDEVKEYNVKQGYDDLGNTQATMLDDLKKTLYGNDHKSVLEDYQSTTQEIQLEEIEEKKDEVENDFAETKAFNIDELNEENSNKTAYDGETIAMAVQHLAEGKELETQDFSEDDFELEESNSLDINQRILEQTQTLQLKIVEQEEQIDNMNSKMVKTNRLLNVLIALLVFAFIVALLLIIAPYIEW